MGVASVKVGAFFTKKGHLSWRGLVRAQQKFDTLFLSGSGDLHFCSKGLYWVLGLTFAWVQLACQCPWNGLYQHWHHLGLSSGLHHQVVLCLLGQGHLVPGGFLLRITINFNKVWVVTWGLVGDLGTYSGGWDTCSQSCGDWGDLPSNHMEGAAAFY